MDLIKKITLFGSFTLWSIFTSITLSEYW